MTMWKLFTSKTFCLMFSQTLSYIIVFNCEGEAWISNQKLSDFNYSMHQASTEWTNLAQKHMWSISIWMQAKKKREGKNVQNQHRMNIWEKLFAFMLALCTPFLQFNTLMSFYVLPLVFNFHTRCRMPGYRHTLQKGLKSKERIKWFRNGVDSEKKVFLNEFQVSRTYGKLSFQSFTLKVIKQPMVLM